MLFGLLAAPVLAQRGELSLGLNALCYPTGVAGLGGTLDYRWRLCPHTELIGQFSATHFWDVGREIEGHTTGYGSTRQPGPTIPYGGIGIGYVGGTDRRGFHIGLLAGGMSVEEVAMDSKPRQTILPALGLSMGHGLGKRVDLSLDTWMVKTTKDELFAIPFLRLSYALFRNK